MLLTLFTYKMSLFLSKKWVFNTKLMTNLTVQVVCRFVSYNIIIFLSERRHYIMFHPLGILRYHWSLMFTFLFTFLFTWNAAGDLKFKFGLCLMKSIEFKNEKKKTWEFKMALAPLCITYSIIKWMQRSWLTFTYLH